MHNPNLIPLSRRSFGQWSTLTLRVVVISTLIGGLIGLLRAEDAPLTSLIIGGLSGTLIGFGCTVCELALFSNPDLRIARKLPALALMGLRAVGYAVVITVGLALPAWLLNGVLPWQDGDFLGGFAVSALVAMGISTAIEIMRLLGTEATAALLSGRYYRARLENRVILVADVVGSTRLGEELGELRFHAFLRDVAQDLALPVDRTRGDVHRYVGDAVIVTWPQERGLRDGACLSCALGMHQILAQQTDMYRNRYGHAPTVRVALHCGQVAAGEIGDWKKEIALLGDTMNTTARIENAARDLGVTTILSDAVRKGLPPQLSEGLSSLPAYVAAGKSAALKLWTPDPKSKH
ncbi:MAG: adenylate/guanylate cyclase domain-containing protein [Paracoccaceae bacterium]